MCRRARSLRTARRTVRELTAEWDQTLQDLAVSVTRSFPGQSWEDTAQELRIFYLTSPRLDEGDERRVRFRLREEAVRICKRERALQCGYEMDDQFTYPVGRLRDLLPLIFRHDDWVLAGSGFTDMPTAAARPAEGNDLLVSLIDVKLGFRRLSEAQREWLWAVFLEGRSDEQMAELHGITVDSARRHTQRVLVRLRNVLDGEVSAHDGPGSRRVLSRHEAMWQAGDGAWGRRARFDG